MSIIVSTPEEVAAELNTILYTGGSTSEALRSLDETIRQQRHNLYQSLRRRKQLEARCMCGLDFGKDQIVKFQEDYPALYILVLNGGINLFSRYSTLSYHPGRSDDTINNDIIYVSMPMHGYSINFNPGRGRVSIGGVYRNTILKVADDVLDANELCTRTHVGHPHVTLPNQDEWNPQSIRDGVVEYHSVCTGNNRFRERWGNQDNRQPAVIMGILRSAALWLTTVNTIDCYGTSLFKMKHTRDVQNTKWMLLEPTPQWINTIFKDFLVEMYSGKTCDELCDYFVSEEWFSKNAAVSNGSINVKSLLLNCMFDKDGYYLRNGRTHLPKLVLLFQQLWSLFLLSNRSKFTAGGHATQLESVNNSLVVFSYVNPAAHQCWSFYRDCAPELCRVAKSLFVAPMEFRRRLIAREHITCDSTEDRNDLLELIPALNPENLHESLYK